MYRHATLKKISALLAVTLTLNISLLTLTSAQTCSYKISKLGSPEINNITVHPSQIVEVGKNITLTCTVRQPSYDRRDATIPNLIRWFDNENNIIQECKGKETPKLCPVELQNVRLTHRGEYSCQAKSWQGCTYAKVKITVNSKVALPPIFIAQPSNQTANVADEVSLTCGVKGDQPYELQWWRNNEKLPSEAKWKVTVWHHQSTTLLTLVKNITDQDYGVYWCMVQNTAGRSYSRSAFVMPKGSLVLAVFTIEPTNRTVRVGERVELFCATSGFPRPVLRWQKNRLDIPHHSTGIERLVLRFDRFNISDVGRFRCKAMQLGVAHYSREATVSIMALPIVKIAPRTQNMIWGKNYSLNCTTEGSPTPVITWKKLTPEFNKTVKVTKGKESVLHFIDVTEKDFGIYFCQATNVAGTVTSDIATVKGEVRVAPVQNSPSDPTDIKYLVVILVPSVILLVLISIVAIVVVRLYKKKKKSKGSKEVIPLNELTGNRLAHPSFTNRNNRLDNIPPLLANKEQALEYSNRNKSLHPASGECTDNTGEQESVLRQHESRSATTAIYMNLLGVTTDWELNWNNLKILEESLGQGEFGLVKKGLFLRKDGEQMDVAVKLLKDENNEDDKRDLIQELNTLKKVGRHENIVCLVGACTQGTVCVVLELVAGANLEILLGASFEAIQAQPNFYTNQLSEFTERQLLRFAADTACGMKHLESYQVVHRDLAARNILVDTRTMIAKVADFGLARDVSASVQGKYIKKSNGRVPWKWTALESLSHGHSTTKSDVWSFGIVLWEISTLGCEPYPEESNVVSLHTQLVRGYRMPRPPQCSREVYELMFACWHQEADQRPTFHEIHNKITSMLYDEKITYINVEQYRHLLTEQTPNHVV